MILITGAIGHSAFFLLERLKAEKYKGKIRAIIRKSHDSKILDESGLDVEICRGDLDDFNFVSECMNGIETVIHIAGIMCSENVINACIKQDVKWVICVHTTGRFSKFRSASSGYIELEDKLILLRDKINITILRPTMIYGTLMDFNMSRLVNFLYKNKFFPVFGKGTNLIQPVHGRDLGNAFYDVMMHPSTTANKEYNLSGGNALTYKRIVQLIAENLKKKIYIIQIPLWLSLFVIKVYNAVVKNPRFKVEQVLRLQEDKAFSFENAARDFGYNPVKFEVGIKEEVEEFLEMKKKNIPDSEWQRL